MILAVETATRAGGVSLAQGANILCSLCGDPQASHSTDLIPNVDRLLRQANIHLKDVDLFAAAVGPGSFTGLRIGLATVKSFAVCLDRPCVGVPTLAAIAHAAAAGEKVAALLPAGRGEVFAQLFSVDENGSVKAQDTAVHAGPGPVLEKYKDLRSLKWAGEGAWLYSEIIRAGAARHHIAFAEADSASGEEWELAGPRERLAESVAALAFAEYNRGKLVSPNELRAIYVRPSDAEINQKWQEAKPQSTEISRESL